MIKTWEQNEKVPNGSALIEACTQMIRLLMFPGGLLFCRHSRPFPPSLVHEYIMGQWRTERLSTWSGNSEHAKFEKDVVNGNPCILEKLKQDDELIEEHFAVILQYESYATQSPNWKRAIAALKIFKPFFKTHRWLVAYSRIQLAHPGLIGESILKKSQQDFIVALDSVAHWTKKENYFIHAKPYHQRNCKTALSLAEIREDALSCFNET